MVHIKSLALHVNKSHCLVEVNSLKSHCNFASLTLLVVKYTQHNTKGAMKNS